MKVYRVCKMSRADAKLSGLGGLYSSGRWHPGGLQVTYAAHSPSLAALEFFVHAGRHDAKVALALLRMEIPDNLEMMELTAKDLPSGWDALPPPPQTMAIGEVWYRSTKTAVLRVPSVIVRDEWNYIINGTHPDTKRIACSEPEPFVLDPRMWK